MSVLGQINLAWQLENFPVDNPYTEAKKYEKLRMKGKIAIPEDNHSGSY